MAIPMKPPPATPPAQANPGVLLPVENMHLVHMAKVPVTIIAQYDSASRLRAAQRLLNASKEDLGVKDDHDHLVVAAAYANKWMYLVEVSDRPEE